MLVHGQFTNEWNHCICSSIAWGLTSFTLVHPFIHHSIAVKMRSVHLDLLFRLYARRIWHNTMYTLRKSSLFFFYFTNKFDFPFTWHVTIAFKLVHRFAGGIEPTSVAEVFVLHFFPRYLRKSCHWLNRSLHINSCFNVWFLGRSKQKGRHCCLVPL